MTALAFDTATAACSVALRRADGELFRSAPPASRLGERPAHTTELLPAILELCDAAGVTLGDVDELAVGVGPGAFTGLRIGVATARAIATANGIGLVPVSSLAALERGAAGATAVIDARRNEFFFRVGGEDLLADPEATVEKISAVGGAAVGDGTLKLRDRLLAAGMEIPDTNDDRHVVDAGMILELAAGATPLQADEVVPNYIRPPDAKFSSRESWMVGATGR